MSWGISENASEKEKLKAEVNDYFHALNAVCEIDYIAYCELYDACMPILEKCYDRMEEKRKTESEDKDADKKCTYKETGCGSCKWQLDCPIEADKAESEDKTWN